MTISIGPVTSRESSASVDQQGRVTREHVEVQWVESDSPASTAMIGALLGLTPADAHPDDPLTQIKSIKIKQLAHRNPWRYDVTVTYSNNVPDRSQIEDDNPLNSPAKIRWEDGDKEVAIYEDRDGKAILTPAKRPYNPPLTMLIPAGRLVINKNERKLNSDPTNSFRKHVNASSWADCDPGTLMLKSISSERDVRNGVVFYPTEYVFEWDPLGWNERVLAQDVYELVPPAGGGAGPDYQRRILDKTKQPVTEPVPISMLGRVIEPEDLPDDAYFQEVKKYPTADFAALRLGI